MLRVGQKVIRTPKTIECLVRRGSTELVTKPMKGEVIFVHSKGRYHTVEFTNEFGVKLKESFDGVEA
jgi:hypothetical protein